jgi:hypothetical protein
MIKPFSNYSEDINQNVSSSILQVLESSFRSQGSNTKIRTLFASVIYQQQESQKGELSGIITKILIEQQRRIKFTWKLRPVPVLNRPWAFSFATTSIVLQVTWCVVWPVHKTFRYPWFRLFALRPIQHQSVGLISGPTNESVSYILSSSISPKAWNGHRMSLRPGNHISILPLLSGENQSYSYGWFVLMFFINISQKIGQ